MDAFDRIFGYDAIKKGIGFRGKRSILTTSLATDYKLSIALYSMICNNWIGDEWNHSSKSCSQSLISADAVLSARTDI